jgi:hypothetical protein
MCTEASEENANCISIANHNTINTANFTSLGDDVQSTGCAH